MTKGRYPEFFQVLVCQIGQNGKTNVVLGKALCVLRETKLPKPVRNLLHTAPRVGFVGSAIGRIVILSCSAAAL